MYGHRIAAVVAVVLASAGAVEAQSQDRGAARRAEAQRQQQGPERKAQPQRGQGQGNTQRAQAQQQGQGQGNAQRAQPQGQGQRARANRGSAARRVSRPVRMDRLPDRLRSLASSRNHGQRVAAVALARGSEFNELPVRYTMDGGRIRLLNGQDQLLLELDEQEARNLGYWDIRRLDPERVRGNAPAFCRSGAGHPVWGREWCIDRGFGLGAADGWLWGRHNPDDIFFRNDVERISLDRGGLLDVLGSIVFDRLALHALTLGLTDPLAGRWIGEPAGPRVMTLHSGATPVAELIDLDRDGRVDVMYVTSR